MSEPKAQVSLMEWLRSGVLAGIGPGHSKPEVEQALGAPFGWIEADPQTLSWKCLQSRTRTRFSLV